MVSLTTLKKKKKITFEVKAIKKQTRKTQNNSLSVLNVDVLIIMAVTSPTMTMVSVTNG